MLLRLRVPCGHVWHASSDAELFEPDHVPVGHAIAVALPSGHCARDELA